MKPVLVGTQDYTWAIRIFVHLYHKYWSTDQILWYGDRPPAQVPDGVEFRQVPCFGEGIWPWQHWFGNGLRSILRDLDDDVICLLLPDHWICEPVDVEGIAELERQMLGHGSVMRANITAGTCLDQHGEVIGFYRGRDLVTVAPTNRHCSFGGGFAFCPGLWNRAALADFLEPYWSLWDCEKLGTEKFARELWPKGWMVIGLRPGPLRRCHGLIHSQPRKVSLVGLSDEDRGAVRGMLPGGWDVIA